MDGPSRSGGFRQSRRSRSQRDRERRRRRVDLADQRATSPSSGSDREVCPANSVLGPGGRVCRPGFPGVRHRPPRRRKRESVSCEEDVIDGFAIASFISFEALEMDCSLKPTQRAAMLMGRGSKRKRGPEENGGGPLSEPEEGAPPSFSRSCWNRNMKKRRKTNAKGGGILLLETGYICDTESESADKASDNDVDPMFTVSTRKVMEPTPVSMASSMAKGCPPLPARCGLSRLMVTPRVSGLERSQERSLEPPYPEPISSTSSSFSCLPSLSPATVARPNHLNSNNGFHRHEPSPSLSKHKPFLTFPGRPQSIYNIGINNRSGTSVKPPSSSASSSSLRPPAPSSSMPLSLIRGPGSSGSLRPPSRAGSGPLFTSSPGLPPPPPLLQVSSHTAADQDLLRHGLNSHFLASQAEREGRRSVPGADTNGAAGRSTPGGPSASSSSSGSSGRTSQAQPNIQPLAFQFHQHNHQHQHTHTHQHFTPFLHPTATAPPLFEKYANAGKMEGLYRHTFFPQYPPSVSGIQPVIPPTGPFGSLQGAFQPKGTGPEMNTRLGVVPHHLQPKDPRLTDPFGTSLKVSNKPGKWCAMHVHVAWMILSHQKKVKLMQADPHKLDFRNELLARLPGAGGLGPLGPLGGGLPSAHDLNRPASLFTAPGGVNPSSSPFIPPSTPHSSFLNPGAHLDPYGRSPPFTPLGALGSSAFGGLGSPTLASSSVFGHKDSPAGVVGGLSNPHDPWNRLHGGPPNFTAGPSWAKGTDKRDERDRGKDMERREILHIKDEKDRDNMLYGRPPVRMSPVAPPQKHRSSTPVSHMNGHGGHMAANGGLGEDLTRNRDRERDRDGDKRPLSTVSSRAPPLGSSSLVTDRDRPRSSSSSVLTTPPPSAPSAPSPLDPYARQQPSAVHGHHNESSHPSQRDAGLPASSSSSATVTALSQGKKPDRTTTPVPKPPVLLPPVKVKEERKEEPEHIPISLPPPPVPSHSYDRPSSRPHHHRSATPSSSSLSLTPTPGVSLPPPAPHPPPHHTQLSLLERSRAQADLEAYLRSAASAGGLVIAGPGGERFASHPHGPQGPLQPPHGFHAWDSWNLAAQQQQQQHQQQQQQRREAQAMAMRSDPHMALRSDPHLALRSDPHLARLLQHQHAAQRFLEAERAAAMAAAVAANSHHPQTSTSSAPTSVVRQEFGLMAHHFDRPPQLGPPSGSLMDEEQRAQIMREDFERARYFGMHPHPHLSGSHLPSPSHNAHLEQLHPGLLSHAHLQPGASTPSPHHPGLYSRLGSLHPHHMPNGIMGKSAAGLVGALSVGAPPPLIPSVTSRSSTPPRGSRLGGPGDLSLYSNHKDGESR